ncbi:MAG: family 43 glycosylhydrolase [Bacteroidales bacterium]|nr:family 43 glycosylhydrolase [Bacteroidales bacterium]
MNLKKFFVVSLAVLASSALSHAQNPIIKDAFTADPSAHVFEGRVYVYPSHDIPAPADYARKDWFCMADYHVYSSDNLVDWVDHGVIVDQDHVPWVNAAGYSMWAPDCNYKNGKYYFYFPAPQKPQPGQRFAGNGIGVAISDTPYGPFECEETPIQGIGGIDPCIFVDDDGTPYLAWSGMGLQVARLKDNMLELDSEPVRIEGIPRGQTEGPFLFKRNGKYYYTFPWVEAERETLAYCMSDNPLGPYEFKGKFMEQSETICWTNHHSFIELDGQWYLFYHHNDYSPYFDKNRSVCVDYVNFNEDGTIAMVTPTLRGVGVTKASGPIQIDRYTDKSDKYVAVEFLNPDTPFDGWKAILWNTTQEREPRWISYARVDFGKTPAKVATMRVISKAGGTVELRADAKDGPVLATFNVPGNGVWTEQSITTEGTVEGIHDLYLLMTNGSHLEVDWVSFK